MPPGWHVLMDQLRLSYFDRRSFSDHFYQIIFNSDPWSHRRFKVFFVGPTGIYLLDFFCSGIQFYLMLSPYFCLISLLYLDLYVLGDDALIS